MDLGVSYPGIWDGGANLQMFKVPRDFMRLIMFQQCRENILYDSSSSDHDKPTVSLEIHQTEVSRTFSYLKPIFAIESNSQLCMDDLVKHSVKVIIYIVGHNLHGKAILLSQLL